MIFTCILRNSCETTKSHYVKTIAWEFHVRPQSHCAKTISWEIHLRDYKKSLCKKTSRYRHVWMTSVGNLALLYCTLYQEPPKGEFDWRLWATQTFLLLWSQSSLLPVQYKRKHVQYLSQSILCLKHLCTELLQYVKLEKACWSQCKKNKSWTPGKNKNSHWHSKSWTCSCLGCLKKHFFFTWFLTGFLKATRSTPAASCTMLQRSNALSKPGPITLYYTRGPVYKRREHHLLVEQWSVGR